MPDDQLNILLAIARPYGQEDVDFQTIARPMLAALQPIRRQVNLKVLRPPSLKQFESELKANKGTAYHLLLSCKMNGGNAEGSYPTGY